MKRDTFLFMLIWMSFSEFCTFFCYYIFSPTIPHFFQTYFSPSFFMTFRVPDGTEIKLTTAAFPEATVNTAEKFINHLTRLCFPARKSLGRVAGHKRGWLRPEAPRQYLPVHPGHRATEPGGAAHPPEKRGETPAKPCSHLCLFPSLDLRFLKGSLAAREAGGSRRAPGNHGGALGCIKPGEAMTVPWLDSCAARYFITGVILSASAIPLKSAGLFTSLHLGIFHKYFAESVPGSLLIFIFFFLNHV